MSKFNTLKAMVVAKLYLKAIISADLKKKDLEDITSDVEALAANVDSLVKLQYIDGVDVKLNLNPYTKRMLDVVMATRKAKILPFLAEMLEKHIAELNGQKIAKIVLSKDSDAKYNEITTVLSEVFGTVLVKKIVNPEIISGFMLEIDSKTIDFSYKSQLKKMVGVII